MTKPDEENASGPFGLGLLIVVTGVYCSLAAFNSLRGAWYAWPTSLLALAGVAVRHMLLAVKRLQPEGDHAFHSCNLGLAVASAAFAIISVIVLAGMITTEDVLLRPSDAPADFDPKKWAVHVANMLWLSAMLSALGASLFCLRLLGTRFGAPAAADNVDGDTAATTQEPFITVRFWSGLCFRVAQAVIYTLVIFCMMWGGGNTTTPDDNGADMFWWLPALGLFIGLFVKAAENLVAGIADRAFAAAQAFVPSRLPAGGDATPATPKKQKTPPPKSNAPNE